MQIDQCTLVHTQRLHFDEPRITITTYIWEHEDGHYSATASHKIQTDPQIVPEVPQPSSYSCNAGNAAKRVINGYREAVEAAVAQGRTPSADWFVAVD